MINRSATMYLINCYAKYSNSHINIYNEDHDTFPDSIILVNNNEVDTIEGYTQNYSLSYIGDYNYDTLV